MKHSLSAILAAILTFGTSGASAANILVNGDFSAGETGWSDANDIATINSGVADIAGGTSPDGDFSQSFATQTGQTVVSFDFFTADPVDRSLNIFLRESAGGGQVNLRVVPGGDVQIFQSGGASWQTLANLSASVVTDGTTVNKFQLTFNDYGGSYDYDVTVNGNTESGVGFFQNQVLDDFATIVFSNDFGTSPFSIDNVVVDPIPEPSATLLGALGFAGVLLRRRR